MTLSRESIIINLFKSNTSIREISRRLNIGRPSIDKYIRRANIKPPSFTRCFADTEFFTNLNETSAYWLGFLLADGNITPNMRGIRLRLKSEDAEHIQKFADALKYDRKVKIVKSGGYNRNKNQAHLIVWNAPLVRYLISIGWDGFKRQGDIRILNAIPDNLKRYLVRGLFDGDGGLTITISKKIISIGCISFHDLHESVVIWFRSFLSKQLNISVPSIKHPKNNKSCSVEWRGNFCTKMILTYLYDGPGPKLKRKLYKSSLIGSSNVDILRYRYATSTA